ncbi:dihydrofolate reductase [Pedobacter riviphilus]|uniref:Dihydrofolate reductase n=1 Tax=Pedobacter riviphilus TaxID=2766984 RepID=A0ABX6TEZ4_9SPHI|nr:dihydrofolate reductase family protein [Pedobacter riviphilus]QNR82955.1 dihydrofolate reductase [Pedobacter riviphilus]
MKKIILNLAVTLDGYIEGPNGEIDWCIMDGDANFNDFLDSIDSIFYGRISYDLWGNYQPGEEEDELMKSISQNINSKKKYVFSRAKANDDTDAIFIHSDIEKKVNEIKNLPGKDIWLYGGAKLISTFLNEGLVDELQLAVHPVILGSGKLLFSEITDRVWLTLKETKSAPSGVVQLIYSVKEK